jgi:hypothetical protein
MAIDKYYRVPIGARLGTKYEHSVVRGFPIKTSIGHGCLYLVRRGARDNAVNPED